MNNNISEDSTIHFVLVGHSKEHILFAVDYYSIKKMVIFTSDNLKEENIPFIEQLIEKNVEVLDEVSLDPFKKDSLQSMTRLILEKHSQYCVHENIDFISALTGGTNLMTISMALFALLKGTKCHYIVKSETNELIELDFFQHLHELKNIALMESAILETKL
jgi:hypothetical protein